MTKMLLTTSWLKIFVTFDIIFDAIAPVDGKLVKIIINLESQKTTRKIHYKLMKRAVYYSIWICMTTQNYRVDFIQEYKLSEKLIHGKFHDEQKNYDIISIVILNLGKKPTSHKLLNLLYLIFMDLKSSAEKETILHDEYHIDITRDMKEELRKMGGLMEPAIEIVTEKNLPKPKRIR